MLPYVIAASLFLLAALPTMLIFKNIPLFMELSEPAVASLKTPAEAVESLPLVSVLIPARDEEAGIGAALESVLTNDYPCLEVIVMDDHSSDATGKIVADFAARDSRVRLAIAPELPDGWNGKQHACYRLAEVSTGQFFLFMDADVRLSHDAVSRLLTRMHAMKDVQLLSGFPSQQTESWSEQLLVPMMHFVLLGFLPLDQMRSRPDPAFGAGCGQLFLARRDGYFNAGGHATIRESRHDGLKLPRSFRSAGLLTDLVDASQIATVRMYRNWPEVRVGVLKNANEGIARSPLIFIFSVLLLGSSVLPGFMLAHGLFWGWPLVANLILLMATCMGFVARGLIAMRLHQSWLGVWLHPVAVGLFVGLQWLAFLRTTCGLPAVAWRGRN